MCLCSSTSSQGKEPFNGVPIEPSRWTRYHQWTGTSSRPMTGCSASNRYKCLRPQTSDLCQCWKTSLSFICTSSPFFLWLLSLLTLYGHQFFLAISSTYSDHVALGQTARRAEGGKSGSELEEKKKDDFKESNVSHVALHRVPDS